MDAAARADPSGRYPSTNRPSMLLVAVRRNPTAESSGKTVSSATPSAVRSFTTGSPLRSVRCRERRRDKLGSPLSQRATICARLPPRAPGAPARAPDAQRINPATPQVVARPIRGVSLSSVGGARPPGRRVSDEPTGAHRVETRGPRARSMLGALSTTPNCYWFGPASVNVRIPTQSGAARTGPLAGVTVRRPHHWPVAADLAASIVTFTVADWPAASVTEAGETEARTAPSGVGGTVAFAVTAALAVKVCVELLTFVSVTAMVFDCPDPGSILRKDSVAGSSTALVAVAAARLITPAPMFCGLVGRAVPSHRNGIACRVVHHEHSDGARVPGVADLGGERAGAPVDDDDLPGVRPGGDRRAGLGSRSVRLAGGGAVPVRELRGHGGIEGIEVAGGRAEVGRSDRHVDAEEVVVRGGAGGDRVLGLPGALDRIHARSEIGRAHV